MTNVLTKYKRKVKKICSSKVYNIILVTNTLALSLFTYIFRLKKLSKAQIKTVCICTRKIINKNSSTNNRIEDARNR